MVVGVVSIGEPLGLAQVEAVALHGAAVELSERGRDELVRARAVVENRLAEGAGATYGINTGFGALAEVRVPASELAILQRNLVRSHAVGVGPKLETAAVRAMMLLRAQVLARGYSGVRPVVVETLVAMLNGRVHPVVPALGSVGACGDLAPLAHLSLALIGEGECEVGGEVMPSARALERAGIAPLTLAPKEGLSLINGTAAMTGVGVLAMVMAERLVRTADVTGAMSLEALKGSHAPFSDAIVRARPHPGAIEVAAHLRALLVDSEIAVSHIDCGEVQDAYSLRCMPQVHGSTRDLLRFASGVLAIELDASTDNPLVLPDGTIRSGGNFHGQPVAAAMDAAAIGMVDLASIAERRVAYLVDKQRSRGLPPFLSRHSGLNSGFMMAQVTAAALVAEARAMAIPRSMDSIPTSADREDHVSMGMGSARALSEVVRLTSWVLAIEALVAAQGLDLRGLRAGVGVERARACLRELVPALDEDRVLAPDFEAARALIESGRLLSVASAFTGPA